MREDPSREVPSSPPHRAPSASAGPFPRVVKVPVFIGLALFGVLYDVVVQRATMITIGSEIPPSQLTTWTRAATFGFNLATVAAAIALATTITRLVRRRAAVPHVGSFALVVFGSVFIVALYRAVAHAPSSAQEYTLMVGRAAGFMLMSILCVTGIRARVPVLQLAFGLWASMVFSSLLVLTLEIMQQANLAKLAKTYDEIVWFLIPIGFAAHFGAFGRWARWRAAIFTVAISVTLLAWQWKLDELYDEALYRTFGVSALGEEHVTSYALLLGLSAGLSLAALTQRSARDRMGGAALGLFFGAGHLPRTLGMITVQITAVAVLVQLAWDTVTDDTDHPSN